jgi:hypothetical protein
MARGVAAGMAKRPTERMATAAGFSPVDNEAPLRWLRRARLAPSDGLAAWRRALGLALLTWLPIAAWALATGRLEQAGDAGESLLQHYGVHVRCLLVIPLLILGEPMLHRAALAMAERLAASAATPAARGAFADAGRSVVRLRDATLPWVLLLGAAIAWSLADDPLAYGDAMAWALDAGGNLAFGGWWFAYVVRPVFLALLLAWLWRIALLSLWMWRVGRIELALVPTHPDRAGGVALIEKLPGAFALVSMALSAMLASRWAHEILHHGASIAAYRHAVIVFVAVWSLLLLLPLLAFAPALARTRKQAIVDYSALVGRQGALVHRRWIEGREVADEPILAAPEIGPVADAAAMYEAVVKMRRVPIGKVSVVGILLPLALPLLVVAALQVPLKDLLLKLA